MHVDRAKKGCFDNAFGDDEAVLADDLEVGGGEIGNWRLEIGRFMIRPRCSYYLVSDFNFFQAIELLFQPAIFGQPGSSFVKGWV